MKYETYCSNEHDVWDELSLKEFGDYADAITYFNQEDDYGDSMRGEWFYADDDSMTIYHGTFSNHNSPGAMFYTYATVFEDVSHYKSEVARLEQSPEFLEE